MNFDKFMFKHVSSDHFEMVKSWLHKEHVKPYYYGEGLANTLKNLELSAQGIKHNGLYGFEHWVAFYDGKPFGFLMTSVIEGPKDEKDPYNKWFSEDYETITLDLLIGDEKYLGKGFAAPMIKAFINGKFPGVGKVLIDPEVSNEKAIHVYEKAGFIKIEKFPQMHDKPNLCWMMHFIPQKEILRRKLEAIYYQFLGIKVLFEVNFPKGDFKYTSDYFEFMNLEAKKLILGRLFVLICDRESTSEKHNTISLRILIDNIKNCPGLDVTEKFEDDFQKIDDEISKLSRKKNLQLFRNKVFAHTDLTDDYKLIKLVDLKISYSDITEMFELGSSALKVIRSYLFDSEADQMQSPIEDLSNRLWDCYVGLGLVEKRRD